MVKARMGLLMDYPVGVPDTFEFALLDSSTGPKWQELPFHISVVSPCLYRNNGQPDALRRGNRFDAFH